MSETKVMDEQSGSSDGLSNSLDNVPSRVGVFAAGVAHDFNNYLAAIVAFSESLLNSEGKKDRRIIELIKQTALEATCVTQQMLIYAGKPNCNDAAIDLIELNDLVGRMEPFLRAISPGSIRSKIIPNSFPIRVRACQLAIQQIVVNTFKMCLDVEELDTHHHIEICIKDTWERSDSVADSLGVVGEELQNCQIEIRDIAGCLPIEEIKKYFSSLTCSDESFSNRFFGNSSGAIEFEKGSSESLIRIVLPFSNEEEAIDDSGIQNISSNQKFENQRTILLVDDDATVLDSVSLLLESMDNNVIPVSSAWAADQVMESQHEQIDCLILDYSMPVTSGLSLLNKFRSIGWTHPAILCSGYAMRIDDHPDAQFWPDQVLAKPYNFLQLQEAIEQACRNKRVDGS